MWEQEFEQMVNRESFEMWAWMAPHLRGDHSDYVTALVRSPDDHYVNVRRVSYWVESLPEPDLPF